MALSQKRAKDRTAMAERVRDLAQMHGFTVEISPALSERGLNVTIHAARGLYCSMTFEPDAERVGGGWGFLGHWNFDYRVKGAYLSPDFADRSVNEFHQRKATTSARDFDDFCAALARALASVAGDRCWDRRREAWEAANPEVAAAAGAGAAYQAFLRRSDSP